MGWNTRRYDRHQNRQAPATRRDWQTRDPYRDDWQGSDGARDAWRSFAREISGRPLAGARACSSFGSPAVSHEVETRDFAMLRSLGGCPFGEEIFPTGNCWRSAFWPSFRHPHPCAGSGVQSVRHRWRYYNVI